MKKIVCEYVRQNIKGINLFIAFIFIFAGIFYLYNINVEAVAYAALLCIALSVVFFAYDFNKFYNKHKLLEELKTKITLGLYELPEGENLIEKDYQYLMKVLYEDRINLISNKDREKSEMIDYYTLWVHQVKTPIAAMTLLLQIEDTDTNKTLSSELFKIEQYVNMVLSYLRIESSSTDFVFKKYKIDTIVKQAVRKYAPLFIRKKIAIELENLDYEIITDEKWLTFVVEQLVSNALKYTQSGKIMIYIKDNSLILKDTGIGIEKEDIPRLGEKGFTGYNGRLDKKATGLGLYLCKEVLKKLSYSILIESKIGTYTKVTIDFGENKLEKY